MADAGVARDPGRLPWLEPYRAPSRKKSNRRSGVAATIGAAGLAVVLTLLMRDAQFLPTSEPAAPQASVLLPAPADMQPPILLSPLTGPEPAAAPAANSAPPVHRAKARVLRRIKAVPTRVAYRTVVKEQAGEAGEPAALDTATIDAAVAIAALPIPPDPPRPTVNPAAQVVRQDGPAWGLQERLAGGGRVAKRNSRLHLPRHHAEKHRADLDQFAPLLPVAAGHAVETACQAIVHQFEVDRPRLHGGVIRLA